MRLRDRLPLLALTIFAVAFATTTWASVGHDELFAVPVQGIWLGLFATELLHTIDRSMHPAHVSVWLVESSGGRQMTGGARA